MKRFLPFLIPIAALIALAYCGSLAQAAGPGATDLTFRDNATNELGDKVERHEGPCGAGTFTEIATLQANATSYLDATTVAGKDYCYRVRAFNNSKADGTGVIQYSGYTNEAGVSYPLAAPAAPSGATAQ